MPWVSLYHVDFSRSLLNLVPRETAEKYCLVPIFVRRVRKQGETLYVAMDDPTNEAAIEDVARAAALPGEADDRVPERHPRGDPRLLPGRGRRRPLPAVAAPPPPPRRAGGAPRRSAADGAARAARRSAASPDARRAPGRAASPRAAAGRRLPMASAPDAPESSPESRGPSEREAEGEPRRPGARDRE